MANNTELDPGTGGDIIATDDVTGVKYQRVKLTDGTEDATTAVAAGGGVEANALRVTVASDSTGVLSVDDNGGSLTVDNATISVVGGGAEATAQRVTIASDSTGVLSVDDNGGSLTVDGTVAVTNTGTFATQVDGAALTALQKIDDPVLVDDAAFTPATSSVMAAGFFADQTATDPVNEGDIGAARMTLNRQVITTVSPSADTEGLSFVKDIDLDETETQIKATAGKLYGWMLYNDGAADVYVKLYNATTANVTVGTTVPDITFALPAGAAANVEYTNGIAFSTAITAAATTLVADNDATAPAANQVVATFFYV